MNKLMGFYELAEMDIPSIPWREYTGKEPLDAGYLWTIRSAVFRGDDLNLPRKVGVTAAEAKAFADSLYFRMRDRGIVIYYPYFLANKSGTLNVYRDRIVIEAVAKDLWNLVTYADREVTIDIRGHEISVNGNEAFLEESELERIISNVPSIRRSFRDEMLEGGSVLLEWSLAQKSDLWKNPVGEEFLVFYEARTVG